MNSDHCLNAVPFDLTLAVNGYSKTPRFWGKFKDVQEVSQVNE